MYRLSKVATLGLGACLMLGRGEAGAQQKPGGSQPGDASRSAISAEELRAHVEALAHDSLGGREPGTPGLQSAARYLASHLTRLGLSPAGDDGAYLNRVPLRRWRMATEASLESSGGSRTLTPREILPVSGLAGLPGTSHTSGAGPIVYAGHLVDPTADDQSLRTADLSGAVVMVRLSAPPGVNAEGVMPRQPLAALFTPLSPAAAVLMIAEEDQDELWGYAAEIARKGHLELISEEQKASLPPFFLISAGEAERILGESLADARGPRTGLGSFRYSLRSEFSPVETSNVVAVLPGSDARRSREFVALGAHYDHVGIGSPENGDSIYNGADDDASGVAALLEIAERFAALPADRRPARSLLFVWHTAEEAGLLGSRSFTNQPSVPRSAIVTQLNIDMIGRNHPDSLAVVGSRRLSTQLGDLVQEVNRRQPAPFVLDYTLDAPDHPEQVFCRSDHLNYAQLGIPVAFFTTGLHADYHRPSDEPSTLDYQKLARVTSLVGDLAEAVANAPERPAVDGTPNPLECPM